MLSDRDRHALNDIESRLDSEDPQLAERLSDTHPGATGRTRRCWIAGVLLALFLVISIGAGLPIVTLVLMIAICGVIVAGWSRTRRLFRNS